MNRNHQRPEPDNHLRTLAKSLSADQHQRLFEAHGQIPPAEFEEIHYQPGAVQPVSQCS